MALDTFAAAPTAAELLGVLLAGERRWGVKSMRRLSHAFLDDDGSRPLWRNCTIHIPGLCGEPWGNAADIDVARLLERTWPELRDELIQASRVASYSPYVQENDSFLDLRHWSTAHVMFMGQTHANRHLLPKTLAAIEEAGGAAEIVSLSRVAPGGHIRPHCGPWNTRLTVHLGIETPDGCSMRVADEWRGWLPGKCLVFDDSFEHEVLNLGREERIVLLLDIWRPDLSGPERAVLEEMLAILQRDSRQSEGAAANDHLGEDQKYIVTSNAEEQFAILPANCPTSANWNRVASPRSREACLQWVHETWIDMRPLSARTRS